MLLRLFWISYFSITTMFFFPIISNVLCCIRLWQLLTLLPGISISPIRMLQTLIACKNKISTKCRTQTKMTRGSLGLFFTEKWWIFAHYFQYIISQYFYKDTPNSFHNIFKNIPEYVSQYFEEKNAESFHNIFRLFSKKSQNMRERKTYLKWRRGEMIREGGQEAERRIGKILREKWRRGEMRWERERDSGDVESGRECEHLGVCLCSGSPAEKISFLLHLLFHPFLFLSPSFFCRRGRDADELLGWMKY